MAAAAVKRRPSYVMLLDGSQKMAGRKNIDLSGSKFSESAILARHRCGRSHSVQEMQVAAAASPVRPCARAARFGTKSKHDIDETPT